MHGGYSDNYPDNAHKSLTESTKSIKMSINKAIVPCNNPVKFHRHNCVHGANINISNESDSFFTTPATAKSTVE